MKHPKLEKVEALADMFYMAAQATEDRVKVDMGNYSVPRYTKESEEENLCGTPACHAGWFGVIMDGGLSSDSYGHYANKMSEYVGMEYDGALENWAEENPEVWGNTYGGEMFSSSRAFGVRKNNIIRLSEIAAHWKAVSVRLKLFLDYQIEVEEKKKELDIKLKEMKNKLKEVTV